MKRDVRVLFLVIAIVNILASFTAHAEQRAENVYHFSAPQASFAKEGPIGIDIVGSSCDSLRARTYSLHDTKRTFYEGKLYCFPYLRNIKAYLERGALEMLGSTEIRFERGPILLGFDERYRAKPAPLVPSEPEETIEAKTYVNVERLEACSDRKDEFCAIFLLTIKFTAPETGHVIDRTERKRYRVFCWNCETMRTSPSALQDALLFGEGTSYFLDGGYAYIDEFSPDLESSKLAQEVKAGRQRTFDGIRARISLAGEENLDAP